MTRIGVIADVQYADAEPGWDFHHTQQRFYRHSRTAMIEAIQDFNESKVDCVLQLGDLLDGINKGKDEDKILRALLDDWKLCESKVLHAVGNHELYCFSKEEALRRFEMSTWNYAYKPIDGWKIIVCDAYGMSCMDPTLAEEAFSYLEKHNPNNVRSFKVDWVAGLKGLDRRYVPYNGGMGNSQIEWLRKELQCSERVIICSHIPICPGQAEDSTIL